MQKMLAEVLLDHSSSDLFVLFAGHIFQDVALWLQRENRFYICVFPISNFVC